MDDPIPRPARTSAHGAALLLAIAYLGFISLGLPDTVAGVAWPSVRDTFGLSQKSFGLVFIALGCGYCVSSFFGGKLIHALGIGTLLTVSSALVAAAMFGNAAAPIWPLFVGCAVIWGLGSGAIDAGLNTYVSSHFSARHVNWLHACYSLGATLGPLLMTAMLTRAGSWRLGYAAVGAVLLTMTAVFLVTRRQWQESAPSAAATATPPSSLMAALQETVVWLQIAIFFLYTGLELTLGQWTFTLLTESRHVAAANAGMLVGCYFGAIGVGRVLFGAFANRVPLDRLVRLATLAIVAGAALFVFAPFTGLSLTKLSFTGLLLTGLGLAPVFPCLMAQTPKRLGPSIAPHAIGFQVSAAMLGAAILPAAAGLLAESHTLEFIPHFALLLAVLLCGTHELLLRQKE